jgi:hypothetical protein
MTHNREDVMGGLLDTAYTEEEQTAVIEQRGGLLAQLWRGQVALPVTYWFWGVGVSLLMTIALALVSSESLLWSLIVLLVTLGYFVFISVAIWRSADRYTGSPVWANLAKIAVAVGVARLVVAVLFGA